jgi:S1-C subfamily serine protease
LNQAKGVVVTYVTPNSPGYTSGISAGNPQNTLMFYGINSRTIINSDANVIIGIDGKQVRQLADLLNYIDPSL